MVTQNRASLSRIKLLKQMEKSSIVFKGWTCSKEVL